MSNIISLSGVDTIYLGNAINLRCLITISMDVQHLKRDHM